MNKNLKSYSKTFWELLKTDLIIHKKNLLGSIVDNIIWVSLTTVVFAYVLQEIGVAKDYGALYLVGNISSLSLFETWPAAAQFIADQEGNNTLSYFLTLPIPAWLFFIKTTLSYAINSIVASLFVLPLGKLLLWNNLSFANFSFGKFILMFIAINIFSGFFTLFIKSLVKSMLHIGTVWSRILFPLWMLGGTQFSWQVIYRLSEPFAYVCLLNPILYGMEGIRAAVLGQEGFINYWICFGMLCMFSILFGFWGTKRLKKRLDFV
jgi:ABC-type polysaccharide/polyol phosphate export permease